MKAQLLAAAMAALLMTACGGGGTLPNGSVVNSPGGGDPPPTKLVNVKVSVTIPPHTKQRGIRQSYVSVNTESLVIELSSVNGGGVSGVNATTINTLSKSHGCKTADGATVCTANASGAVGDDVFAVTTYSQVNAIGSVLSVGTVQAKIAGNGGGVPITNKLSLSLDGVIAGLQLTLSPSSGQRGKAVKSKVLLTALDATGAQIVGPSRFASPIALAVQGDSDKAFLLQVNGKAAASFSIEKPTSNITLTYDGNSQASPATVAATVDGPGSTGVSADFELKGKAPPPPVGTIYALNLGSNDGQAATVTEYDGKSSGNSAPQVTLNLSAKLYARSIAVDSAGNIYIGYFDNAYGFSPSQGRPDRGNEIAVYPPGASGNAPPTYVLTYDKSTSTAVFPLFMSFDPSGNLVTFGATKVDGNGGNDAVLTYPPGSKGQASPAHAWAFGSPTLYYSGPTGLAVDGSGNFYVNAALHSSLGPSYGLFIAQASDNGNPSVNPSRTIPWDTTTELTPQLTTNVSLNTSGEIFIGNTALVGSGSYPSCQGRANVFSAGTTGGTTDVPPLRVITLQGVYTQNPQCDSSRNPLVPYFPALTPFGSTLFVADDFNNAIDAFSSNAHGNAKPEFQIAGSATGLNAPISLVITSPQ